MRHVTSHDHKMAEFVENGLHFPKFPMIFNLNVPNWLPMYFLSDNSMHFLPISAKIGSRNFLVAKYAKFPERPIFH